MGSSGGKHLRWRPSPLQRALERSRKNLLILLVGGADSLLHCLRHRLPVLHAEDHAAASETCIRGRHEALNVGAPVEGVSRRKHASALTWPEAVELLDDHERAGDGAHGRDLVDIGPPEVHVRPVAGLAPRRGEALHGAVGACRLGRPTAGRRVLPALHGFLHGLRMLDQLPNLPRLPGGLRFLLGGALLQRDVAADDAELAAVAHGGLTLGALPGLEVRVEEAAAAAEQAAGAGRGVAAREVQLGEEVVHGGLLRVLVRGPAAALALAPEAEGVLEHVELEVQHLLVARVAAEEGAPAPADTDLRDVLPELRQGPHLLGQEVEAEVVGRAHHARALHDHEALLPGLLVVGLDHPLHPDKLARDVDVVRVLLHTRGHDVRAADNVGARCRHQHAAHLCQVEEALLVAGLHDAGGRLAVFRDPAQLLGVPAGDRPLAGRRVRQRDQVVQVLHQEGPGVARGPVDDDVIGPATYGIVQVIEIHRLATEPGGWGSVASAGPARLGAPERRPPRWLEPNAPRA
mmetsp:Transcript_14661/g.44219  ORF Transcript_14661/g.44219 Transcript_14661/m.44219 type:complete len:519 (-) Transcript_14661:8-1564(-)